MKPDVVPALLPGCCVQCGASLVGRRPQAHLCSDICKTNNQRRKKRKAIDLFVKLGMDRKIARKTIGKQTITVIGAALEFHHYSWQVNTQDWVLTQ